MLIQNSVKDTQIRHSTQTKCQRNHFAIKNNYDQQKREKAKHQKNLPKITAKPSSQITATELMEISHTKSYKSQPSKASKTQQSDQIKTLEEIYSQKHKIELGKTKKLHQNKLQHVGVLTYQKEPSSLSSTNKIVYKQSQSEVKKHKQNSFVTNAQQLSASKLSKPPRTSEIKPISAETFQQTIIRNRLKIKSSLQMAQKTPLNNAIEFKSNQRFRTQINDQQDFTKDKSNSQFSKFDTDVKMKRKTTNQSKTNYKIRNIEAKYKHHKNNFYFPSFTQHKITSKIMQNLVQRIELEKQINDYDNQSIMKESFVQQFEQKNDKLEKEIERIQSYFKTNKKQWYAPNLEQTIKNQPQMVKLNDYINTQKQRARSLNVGKIVKQGIQSLQLKNKLTPRHQQQEKFEDIGLSEESEEKTVVLHDNTYRREIIHFDQTTEQKSQGLQQLNKLSKMPSDELFFNQPNKIHQSRKQPVLQAQLIKNHSRNDSKAAQQQHQKNKRSSAKRDECIIF